MIKHIALPALAALALAGCGPASEPANTVAFDAGNDFYDEETGQLTVTDGTHTAVIQLFGQYVASDFAFASDGHGGTLVTGTQTADPAAAIMQLAAHA